MFELLLWGVELAWLGVGKSVCGKTSFHTLFWTPVTSIVLLGGRSPQSFMAYTVCVAAFRTKPPRSVTLPLPLLSSASRSRTAFETTVEMTPAKASQRAPMAFCISVSRLLLLTEDELTILAAEEGLGRVLEAVMKAAQVLDQAGCAY